MPIYTNLPYNNIPKVRRILHCAHYSVHTSLYLMYKHTQQCMPCVYQYQQSKECSEKLTTEVQNIPVYLLMWQMLVITHNRVAFVWIIWLPFAPTLTSLILQQLSVDTFLRWFTDTEALWMHNHIIWHLAILVTCRQLQDAPFGI